MLDILRGIGQKVENKPKEIRIETLLSVLVNIGERLDRNRGKFRWGEEKEVAKTEVMVAELFQEKKYEALKIVADLMLDPKRRLYSREYYGKILSNQRELFEEEVGENQVVTLAMLALDRYAAIENRNMAKDLLLKNFKSVAEMANRNLAIDKEFSKFLVRRSDVEGELGVFCRQEIDRRLTDENDNSSAIFLVNNYFSDFEKLSRVGVEVRMTYLVAAMGLPIEMAEDVAKTWCSYEWEEEKTKIEGKNRLFEVVWRNLKAIEEIKKVKGVEGVKTLYRDYGITHFGRYPAEILIKQLEETNEPYGIWLGPANDHNGAFCNDYKAVKGLYESAQKIGFGLKIIEARGKLSLARRLLTLDRKFGKENKISFGVISGHGEIGYVCLGKDLKEIISVDDLAKDSAKRLRSVYGKKVPFFFNSCYGGGGDRSIAKDYSAYGDSETIGSDKSMGKVIIDLKVDDNDELYFEGYYKGDSLPLSKYFKQGEEVVERVKKKSKKEKEAEEIKHKQYLETMRRVSTDKKTMQSLWKGGSNQSRSMLEDVLTIYKLNPVWEDLVSKYGVGARVKMGMGVEGEDGRMIVNLGEMESIMTEGFAPSTGEEFRDLSKIAYEKFKNGELGVKVLIVVEVENEGLPIQEKILVDISDLYPENIK